MDTARVLLRAFVLDAGRALSQFLLPGGGVGSHVGGVVSNVWLDVWNDLVAACRFEAQKN